MTIETRFNEGDKLFFISDAKKVVETVVRGFKIERIDGVTKTIWLCNTKPDEKIHLKVEDQFAYPSKQALLNSL